MRGRIFDIQRFCLHDGPGIRTTVFMKGCPLRCPWCHNPEGRTPGAELSFMADRCVGCGYCLRLCPRGAHVIRDGQHVLNRDVCIACGRCAEGCAGGALELIGREVSAAEVLAVVRRDKPFYETSGGGMTLSGGEPTAQPDFALALLQAARAEGLHTALETCGYVRFEELARLLPFVDLVLYDLKELDDARHREWVGVPNAMILENLRRAHDAGHAIVLRLPIIPGYNDRPDHFEVIANLARSLPKLRGVEILPYHPLGTSKAARLGYAAGREAMAPTPEAAKVAEWAAALSRLGVRVLPR